jgi:hypothetical protein
LMYSSSPFGIGIAVARRSKMASAFLDFDMGGHFARVPPWLAKR